jgi:transposase
VLVCDRYSAYKSLALECDKLILAFCWAHVRRDFLKVARSWPELESWMFTWVDDIRELYRLNAARLNEWDERLPLDQQSSAFDERQHELVTKLSEMQARCEAPLQEPVLHLAQQKVLSSLQNHWDGLTVFVTRPEVAMDNNTAERILRNPVAGRKNYYGSGSVWSAHFAAMMFSVLQTLLLWGLNPHHGLSAFLQACAEDGGQSPADLSPFVPWQMSAERREALSRPLPMMVPALGGLTQEQLRAPLFEPGGALSALSSETQDQLYDEAKRLATIFQRSSSNVEGRNGYLSLRSHQLRGLDLPRKRECFTAIHNFFFTRRDGTTAASAFSVRSRAQCLRRYWNRWSWHLRR